MNIVVFGASGKVGRLVVHKLLTDGHHVTAFVHQNNVFKVAEKLVVVLGDVHSAASVKKALGSCDAVVSTLGSWGTKSKDILSSATKNIVPAMDSTGITRIVSLTGSDAYAAGDTQSLVFKFSHALLDLLAPRILRDAQQHIELLKHSSLDWTVLRSPTMTTRGNPTAYRITLQRPKPWQTVNRQSVATVMATLATTKTHLRQAVYITKPV